MIILPRRRVSAGRLGPLPTAFADLAQMLDRGNHHWLVSSFLLFSHGGHRRRYCGTTFGDAQVLPATLDCIPRYDVVAPTLPCLIMVFKRDLVVRRLAHANAKQEPRP